MKRDHQDFNALANYTKALSVALGYRDQSTQMHSERVQGLSAELGERCSLSEKELLTLRLAASFHDIGKIGIPDRILLKPDNFDQAELEQMRQHAVIGEKIMAATELQGSQQAAKAIRHHHEHYDGSGYPDRLSGEGIPIFSRIISIADSYDAMAVTRPYHHAKTHPLIMAIMHDESGWKLDPELMHIFSGMIESSRFKTTRT